jgi:hypothetical protein
MVRAKVSLLRIAEHYELKALQRKGAFEAES